MFRSTTIASLFVVAMSSGLQADTAPTTNEPFLNAFPAYAGTFLCAAGEMAMTLQLTDTGPLPRECDPDCDTVQTQHGVEGIIQFFGTVSNPDAPEGAFKAKGTAQYGFSDVMGIATVNMDPDSWIDQPDNFGSSGLTMMVAYQSGDVPNFEIAGRPTAEGCYEMHLAVMPQ